MDEFLEKEYSLKILDSPFNIIDLIAKIYGLFVVFIGIVIILPSNQMLFSIKISVFFFSFILYLFHLIRKKINPHLFHSPHIPSLSIPLNESIRTNTLCLYSSCLYTSYALFDFLKITKPIDQYLLENSQLSSLTIVLIRSISVVFFISAIFYISELIGIFKNKFLEANEKRYLLGQLIIVLFFIIIYLTYFKGTSFLSSLYSFGKFLLGSITIIMVKDLFVGKWTHEIPNS